MQEVAIYLMDYWWHVVLFGGLTLSFALACLGVRRAAFIAAGLATLALPLLHGLLPEGPAGRIARILSVGGFFTYIVVAGALRFRVSRDADG